MEAPLFPAASQSTLPSLTPSVTPTPTPAATPAVASTGTGFQPLTPQQYQAARSAGFSPDQIIKNEQIRKTQATVPAAPVGSAGQSLSSKPGETLGNDVNQIAQNITNFSGGAALANQIGTRLAQLNTNNPVEKEAIGKTAPSASATFGSALQVGALLAPIGEGADALTAGAKALGVGDKLAELAGNVGASTGAGYAFDVGNNLQSGKTDATALEPGGATALGAGIPLGGEALSAGLRKFSLGDTSQYISDQYQKGVRPTVVGKSTGTQLAAAKAKQLDAIQAIVENKPNLNIVDAHGEPTKGVPTNLHEFTQAITKTKTDIFKQYDALQKAAGKAGATLDLNPVAKELQKFASSPVINDLHPDIARYANARAEALTTRGSYTPEQAQEAIKTLNTSLESFYKNPSYEAATRASIDSLIVNKMRSGLDSAIEAVRGEEGPSYQALKRKYGALSSIEKDVTHRQIVDGRKNPVGLVSGLSNIATAAELIRGIATLNPVDFAVGAGTNIVKRSIEHLNNPNTAIKKVFQAAEKTLSKEGSEYRLSKRSSTAPPPAEESKIASAESTTAPKPSQVPTRFQSPGDFALKKGAQYLEKHPPSLGLALKDVNKMSPAERAANNIPKDAGGGPNTPFEGFSDITTNVLDDLKGRTTVSKTYITDSLNRQGIPKAEKEAFSAALDSVGGEKVNVKDFADAVKTELLPLERNTSDLANADGRVEPNSFHSRYHGVTLLDEIRGDVADYREHIYSSPIQVEAGNRHFGGAGTGADNYFAHTRTEDLSPTATTGYDYRYLSEMEKDKAAGNSYSHNDYARLKAAKEQGLKGIGDPTGQGDTRRVLEVQSDLFQKGRLESEFKDNIGLGTNRKAAEEMAKEDPDSYAATQLKRESEIAKLKPYENTWQDRIVREEVKQAALDGKTKLQFPTGETAMRIEGLVNRADKWVTLDNEVVTGNNIKAGDLITYQTHEGVPHEDRRFLITKNNGDGTFEAVDSLTAENDHELYNLLDRNDMLDDGRAPSLEELQNVHGISNNKPIMKRLGELSEQLSAQDTIDKNNPIYKFYEGDMRKFLQKKYNAQLVTDPQGVSWYEVNVPKEAGSQPVKAFGKVKIGALGAGAAVGAAALAARPQPLKK